jgi:hypothetical protein
MYRDQTVWSLMLSTVLVYLDFFHSRFGSGCGGDTGGDVPAAESAASSRALFFPPAAFAVFDGEGFILQVHGVFTRNRWGATVVDSYSSALGSTILSTAAVRTGGDFWLDLLEWLRMCGVKNPKGFGFYL